MRPIEPLGLADLEGLRELSQAIGWRHTGDDWRTILEVGRVFGHRVDGGGFASSGALFGYGAAFASIGMILVAPAFRGRGLARAVMRQCLTAAGARAVTLIATAQGEPLYRGLGFVEVERVCRVITKAPLRGPRLEPITTRELPDVIGLDTEAFGADRGAVLSAFLGRAEASAVVSDARGGISGFGMAVRQGGRLAIGPVVARDTAAALALVRSLAGNDEGEIRIEVPARQTAVLEEFAGLGAKPSDDAPVMLHGAAAMPGRRDGIYALASRGLG